MADSKELQIQEKKELVGKEEQTAPAAVFVPHTDIFETADDLTIVLEMPGVTRDGVEIGLEKDVLDVQGKINFSNYENLKPAYTEYNVGHFARRFSLSSKIDQNKISAEMRDGVLTLRLPKAAEAKPRKIVVN